MTVKVTIVTLSGINHKLDLDPSITMKQIKEILAKEEGIPAVQQRLLYKGLKIEDTQTIESQGIKNDDVIHMLMNLKGGS